MANNKRQEMLGDKAAVETIRREKVKPIDVAEVAARAEAEANRILATPLPAMCGNCLYSRVTNEGMSCHRLPPQYVNYRSIWAPVPIAEWCGEHKPKGATV